jgi:hypothetical protein
MERANVRYGSQGALRKLVDAEPALLYDSFYMWVEVHEHEENISSGRPCICFPV